MRNTPDPYKSYPNGHLPDVKGEIRTPVDELFGGDIVYVVMFSMNQVCTISIHQHSPGIQHELPLISI